ncbi:hypothetical protein TNCV_3485861 [Trichonephila clavipes]|nr:hypothetical protein TNCV_3485861 [Trichonephila clavipes]
MIFPFRLEEREIRGFTFSFSGLGKERTFNRGGHMAFSFAIYAEWVFDFILDLAHACPVKKCPACCVMIGRDRSSQKVGVEEDRALFPTSRCIFPLFLILVLAATRLATVTPPT